MRRAGLLIAAAAVSCAPLATPQARADQPAPVTAAPAATAAGDPVAGKRAFGMQCRACHQAADGAGSGAGPNLFGVIGRPAAGDGAFEYSQALKDKGKAGLKWDTAQMDAYLKKPQALVPGTAMPVQVSDAQTRADIVAYLTTLKN